MHWERLADVWFFFSKCASILEKNRTKSKNLNNINCICTFCGVNSHVLILKPRQDFASLQGKKKIFGLEDLNPNWLSSIGSCVSLGQEGAGFAVDDHKERDMKCSCGHWKCGRSTGQALTCREIAFWWWQLLFYRKTWCVLLWGFFKLNTQKNPHARALLGFCGPLLMANQFFGEKIW